MRDLATFQALTGQEPHGLAVDPGFVDTGAGDYHLDSASGLVDAGLLIPGINDDYAGRAPDIGAFEYESAHDFAMKAMPFSQSIDPGGVATYTIELTPLGAFSSTVALTSASPSPYLTVVLSPTHLVLPGQSALTAAHSYTGTAKMPALWATVPVTGSGGGVSHTASVRLLVGGASVYLPLVMKQ